MYVPRPSLEEGRINSQRYPTASSMILKEKVNTNGKVGNLKLTLSE